MSGDLAAAARANRGFKQVLATGRHMQVTTVRLAPGAAIGAEVHADYDQFNIVVEGNGVALVGRGVVPLGPGAQVFVAAGTSHDVLNTHPRDDLVVTIVYAPPKLPPGGAYATAADVPD
jgi:mannose-6-phosphate isomerase-like protein (cupin superfamily)